MKLLKYIAVISLLSFLVLYVRSNKYPLAENIDQMLFTEPVQTPVTKEKFQINSGGESYSVTPKYSYDIYGLVVSQHKSDGFVDLYHEKFRDMFNIKDVCLIWGQNLVTNSFHNIKFKNGDFSCSYRTFNETAYQNFDPTKFSNNHLLAGSEEVITKLKKIGVGDQIQLKGYLVDYERADGYRRGSSVTRTDTGNGACEVLYVENVEVISHFSKLNFLNSL